MIIVSFHYPPLAFQVPGTHLDKYHNDWWIMELFPDLDQLTIQRRTTSRTNLNASLSKPIDENTFLRANAFYSKYDFELYSNFTFFLEDPINGDQIRQKENRSIYGMNAELNKKVKSNDWDALFQLGVGFALMLLLIRNYHIP
jgi:hypothetical protein